ncbi:hypothetical protein CSKR_101380 [Clonorchis sinensis]|uniref:Uncharacterized protein n=2 Tax=Clonorchis sinensis TaxID=79923 RepID=A0A8T1MPJ2_CLOSI|nr:hypothetical protein CSKR_101380 [Clonorchis sinensis]GAA50633.1 hypothetical protein CLF_104817 [Clonorchis sinensis]
MASNFWSSNRFSQCVALVRQNGVQQFAIQLDLDKLPADQKTYDAFVIEWLVSRMLNNYTGNCQTTLISHHPGLVIRPLKAKLAEMNYFYPHTVMRLQDFSGANVRHGSLTGAFVIFIETNYEVHRRNDLLTIQTMSSHIAIILVGPENDELCDSLIGKDVGMGEVIRCKPRDNATPIQVQDVKLTSYLINVDAYVDKWIAFEFAEQMNLGLDHCRYNAYPLKPE